MAHYFLVSDALRLVAAFNPKCASQSIRRWCAAAIEAATDEPVPELDRLLVEPDEVAAYEEYWKVFFVRDPMARLVGVYARWVIPDDSDWCFADVQQRLPMRDKTFRQFLFALLHLHRHGQEPQHHLTPQLRNAGGIKFDEVVAVEQLSAGLAGLNRRLGVSVPIPHLNRRMYDPAMREPVVDRRPNWFREHGVPAPEFFYDEEALAIASEIYAEDVAYYRRTTGLEVLGCGISRDGAGASRIGRSTSSVDHARLSDRPYPRGQE
jgi:hypothetical protein